MELYTASKLMRKSTIYFFPSPKSLLLKYCMLFQAPPDTIANAMYTVLPVIVSGMNYARKGLNVQRSFRGRSLLKKF
jgi:hypothetical protein